MKKKLTILLFLTICLNVLGQNEKPDFKRNESTNKVSYSEVVILDSLITKEVLYSKAKEWFAKSYNSSNNVLQMDSRESGKLIGKALLNVNFNGIFKSVHNGGVINYTISIYLKKGKYKYEITDFYHEGGYVNGGKKTPNGGPIEVVILRKKGFWGNSYKKTYLKFLIQMDEHIKSLIMSLKKSMKESTIASEEKW